MIIVLNERVLETLLTFGFRLVEEGLVGYWGDGSPKYGFKLIGPSYLTRWQSKKIASSVMNDYQDVIFFIRDGFHIAECHGKQYYLHTMYTHSPRYLFLMQALRTKAFDLIRNSPQWANFIQEM